MSTWENVWERRKRLPYQCRVCECLIHHTERDDYISVNNRHYCQSCVKTSEFLKREPNIGSSLADRT